MCQHAAGTGILTFREQAEAIAQQIGEERAIKALGYPVAWIHTKTEVERLKTALTQENIQ